MPASPSSSSSISSTSSTSSSSPSESDSDENTKLSMTSSVHRRYSYSNIHDNGRQRLHAAKKKEYEAKMSAFDELIQKRRGSTLSKIALAPDVPTNPFLSVHDSNVVDISHDWDDQDFWSGPTLLC
ncbi:128_t:CDS:2 [Ambispora gerdemannii]|uniref:128_t:CDS:1 n=1 Tax=Ambispora gerdemannii TaxID=144530 RepID=A0A9N8WHA6_9GLOM|nr:128_t:CDS:2 [Ambispora gerdemannii]